MPLYNKLVRDLIPQVIEKSGKQFTTRILEDEEYIMELRKKLQEEVQEYLEADNDKDSLEELADLMELIHTLTKTHQATVDELEEIRQHKAKERGGFNDKIFLIEVDDE